MKLSFLILVLIALIQHRASVLGLKHDDDLIIKGRSIGRSSVNIGRRDLRFNQLLAQPLTEWHNIVDFVHETSDEFLPMKRTIFAGMKRRGLGAFTKPYVPHVRPDAVLADEEILSGSKGKCTWGFESKNRIAYSAISGAGWTSVPLEGLKRASGVGAQQLGYTCGLNSSARVLRVYDYAIACDNLVKKYDPYLSVNFLGVKVGAKPTRLCEFLQTQLDSKRHKCTTRKYSSDADAHTKALTQIKQGLARGDPTIIVMYCNWTSMHYVTLVGYNDKNEFAVWNTNGAMYRVHEDVVLHWMKIDASSSTFFYGMKPYEFVTIESLQKEIRLTLRPPLEPVHPFTL